MADNVAITAGSGTTIATDDVSGVHYQRVKLMDGTADSSAAIPGDATNGLDVDVTRVSGTVVVGGETAHDSAVSTAKPVLAGGVASTGLTGATLVADADVARMVAGTDGVQVVRPYAPLEDLISGNVSDTSGNSTAVIAAAGTGVKVYLTTVVLVNSSTTFITANVLDGSTVKLTVPVPPNGGVVVNMPVPLAGTANTAWNVDGSAAVTTLYATFAGFKSKI